MPLFRGWRRRRSMRVHMHSRHVLVLGLALSLSLSLAVSLGLCLRLSFSLSNSAGAQARHRAWFVILLGCMQALTSRDHPGCTTCRSCRSTSCKGSLNHLQGEADDPEDGAEKSSWRCDNCLVQCTLCKAVLPRDSVAESYPHNRSDKETSRKASH